MSGRGRAWALAVVLALVAAPVGPSAGAHRGAATAGPMRSWRREGRIAPRPTPPPPVFGAAAGGAWCLLLPSLGDCPSPRLARFPGLFLDAVPKAPPPSRVGFLLPRLVRLLAARWKP